MRYRWIDIARGLAMLMVIVGHVSAPVPAFAAGQNFWFMGNLPIFFFFSGLLFHPKPFKERLITNFNTLLLLYISFALLILAYVTAAVHFTPASWSIKATLLGSLWAVGDNGSMPMGMMSLGAVWFFVALGLATLLFGTVVSLAQRSRYQTVVTVALSLVLFGIGFAVPASAPCSLRAVFLSQLFLMLGYVSQTWVKRAWSLGRIVVTGVIGIGIWYWAAQQGTFYLVAGHFTGPIWQMLIGAIASVFGIMAVAQLIDRYLWQVGDRFAWFGRYSAVVLFVHAFMILILGKIFLGPTTNEFVLTYGRMIAWILMVLTNVGIITVVVNLMLGIPVINKLFMDRQWPIAPSVTKSGRIKA